MSAGFCNKTGNRADRNQHGERQPRRCSKDDCGCRQKNLLSQKNVVKMELLLFPNVKFTIKNFYSFYQALYGKMLLFNLGGECI